jgi:hypothetical protein
MHKTHSYFKANNVFVASFPPGKAEIVKEETELDYYDARKDKVYYNSNGMFAYTIVKI